MSLLFEFRPQQGVPTLIAFGGGKGGIGKSLLSANFGAALAQAGHQVLVVDLDLGGTNLHTLMGLPEPETTLSDFISRRVAALDELIIPTAIPGLKVLPAARDDLDAPLLKAAQRDKLLRHLKKAHFDFILLDLGAGSSANTLDFFHAAAVGFIVVTAEKPSIENAHRFLKALIERQIKRIIPEDHANLRGRVGKGEPLSRLLLQETPDLPPELHEILRGLLAPLRLFVIANQIRAEAQHQLARHLTAAARKYYPLHLEPLGHVPYDPAIYETSASGQLLALAQPRGPAYQAIGDLARVFLRLQVAPPVDVMADIGHPWAAQNPYVFLGIPPHASAGEIELAANKIELLLAPGSLAIHSLFNHDEIRALIALAHKFRADLLSAARPSIDARLERELALMRAQSLPSAHAAPVRPESAKGAAGADASTATAPASVPGGEAATGEAPARAPVRLSQDTPQFVPPVLGTIFSGRVLKATREMHGLTLDDVARETKIRRWYFECIEEESYPDLPAPVYLKGFLRQFAGILRLDGDKVVQDYLARMAPPVVQK